MTGALHVLYLQLSPLTTSVILGSNKIQNGDIPVPAKPDPPGKWPLKRRESTLINGDDPQSALWLEFVLCVLLHVGAVY